MHECRIPQKTKASVKLFALTGGIVYSRDVAVDRVHGDAGTLTYHSPAGAVPSQACRFPGPLTQKSFPSASVEGACLGHL